MRSENSPNTVTEYRALEFQQHAQLLQDLLRLNAQLKALDNPAPPRGAPSAR